MQTVLVTGASGFIGSHLVSELLQRGNHVRCLVRPSSQVAHLRDLPVELVQGSLDSPDSYRQAIDGCDAVINAAGLTCARSQKQLFEVNGRACAGLARACRAASNPPRLLHISSLAAAGPPPQGKNVRDEADLPEPISVYGSSKREGEIELQKLAGDLPITVVRPGVVFGPRNAQTAAMFRSIYRLRLHFVVGFRTPPLALIHVDDLVRLIIDAAMRGETLQPSADPEYSPQGIYFACDDAEFPNYWQLGQRIARSMQRPVFVWPLWRWTSRLVALSAQTALGLRGKVSTLNVDKIREASARSWACSSEKARQQFGFQVAKPLDVRLQETSTWYRENRWL